MYTNTTALADLCGGNRMRSQGAALLVGGRWEVELEIE